MRAYLTNHQPSSEASITVTKSPSSMLSSSSSWASWDLATMWRDPAKRKVPIWWIGSSKQVTSFLRGSSPLIYIYYYNPRYYLRCLCRPKDSFCSPAREVRCSRSSLRQRCLRPWCKMTWRWLAGAQPVLLCSSSTYHQPCDKREEYVNHRLNPTSSSFFLVYPPPGSLW